MTTVSFIQIDITRCGADAVVNAANEQLIKGGGVCGAIFLAAGERELATACRALGSCRTGSAKATAGFGLARHGTRFIIHAVGPVWPDGVVSAQDAERLSGLLRSAQVEALRIADELGATSVALPAISTGIFRFPVERAAEIFAEVVHDYRGPLEEIRLVERDGRERLEAFAAAYQRRSGR